MTRLLGAIVYNWPLKLMAIVLATLLYAGLVVSQSTFEIPAALQIHPLNQPLTAVILGNLPYVSRVRYVANGDVGAGPTPDSFRATIDLSGVNPEAGSTYVKIDVSSNDPRFLAVDWEPRGINVQLDPFRSYQVPVRVNKGTVPDNLDVRPAELSVSTVTVSGPDSVVKFVVEARADVLIDPSGTPVDRDVPLIPVDQLGNRLTPVQVEPASVHVTIAVFNNSRKKVLAVNPIVTGTPPQGYVVDTITVTPSTVTVEGNADQLSALVRADTKAISIGTATGTIDTDVDLDLPAGVLPIGSKSVHLTITLKVETGTKAFAAALVPVGRQPGLEYRFSTLNILVNVAGPLADLDRLDPSSFTVPLDVTGLGVGVHEVMPTPNLQAGLRLLNVDPATVTVTITAPASPAPSAGG
ncbi:MAG TPA: CdaR family protein [Candidatus Limnocylindrales bacterium]|nr:CdaR family protein [Candidatus Limnocylindrales bacterium]